jgi:hypothetical protein
VSVRVTPVAGEAPLFVTSSTYGISPPAATVAGAVLVTPRSAVGTTVTSASSSLSAVVDSVDGVDTVAVFVLVPTASARTRTVTSISSPGCMVPKAQSTVPLASVHVGPPGVTLSNVTPAGSGSLSVTLVAADAPSLDTVIV